jgi:hypothetical protein
MANFERAGSAVATGQGLATEATAALLAVEATRPGPTPRSAATSRMQRVPRCRAASGSLAALEGDMQVWLKTLTRFAEAALR